MNSGNKILGYAYLNLKQFASGLVDKLDYLVLFSSPLLKLCSLKATIGFTKTQLKTEDLQSAKLEPFEGIYIPQEDFFTADPLPDEWMEVIPKLSSQLPLDAISRLETREHVQKQSASDGLLFDATRQVYSARLRPPTAKPKSRAGRPASAPNSRRTPSSFIAPTQTQKPVSISKTLGRRTASREILSKLAQQQVYSPIAMYRPRSAQSTRSLMTSSTSLTRQPSPLQRQGSQLLQRTPSQLLRGQLSHILERKPSQAQFLEPPMEKYQQDLASIPTLAKTKSILHRYLSSRHASSMSLKRSISSSAKATPKRSRRSSPTGRKKVKADDAIWRFSLKVNLLKSN